MSPRNCYVRIYIRNSVTQLIDKSNPKILNRRLRMSPSNCYVKIHIRISVTQLCRHLSPLDVDNEARVSKNKSIGINIHYI